MSTKILHLLFRSQFLALHLRKVMLIAKIYLFGIIHTKFKYIYWERILKTIKQQNKQTICIWTNRKVETKLFLLPIGPDIIVYLFGCLIVFKIRSQVFCILESPTSQTTLNRDHIGILYSGLCFIVFSLTLP